MLKAILKFHICTVLFLGCSSKANEKRHSVKPAEPVAKATNHPKKSESIDFTEFDRTSSFDRIKEKFENKEPLVIHIRIPLCDNKNQGIVPVSRKLGNGFDLKNNLYWGAMYDFKTHFKKSTDWELISSKKDLNKVILERIIFKTVLLNESTAYIVADAYRGDKMKVCLTDFLNSTAGYKSDSIVIDNRKIGISSNADLLVFNGHNGLMDYQLDFVQSKDDKVREAAVIGCVSHKFFKDHFLASKAYPVLMTTNLMAPEAYVAEAVISSWLKLVSEDNIRNAAANAYNKYQKCGINGAMKLFKTGW